MGPGRLPMGHMFPMTLQDYPVHPHLQRRPPLLLEVRSDANKQRLLFNTTIILLFPHTWYAIWYTIRSKFICFILTVVQRQCVLLLA